MSTHIPLPEQRKSYEANAWARQTRGHTNPTQKLMLMILAEYWNPAYGYAWPTTRMLADDAEINVRSVIRHLHNLRDQGFITINHNVNGEHSRNNTYSFHFEKSTGDKLTRVIGDTGDELTGVTSDATGVTSDIRQVLPVTTTGVTSAYLTPSNPYITDIEPLKDQRVSLNLVEPVTVRVPFEIMDGTEAEQMERIRRFQDVPHNAIVTTEYLEHLDELYGSRLNPQALDFHVAEALNHQSYKKWTNKKLGVTQWVGRQFKWAGENKGKAKRVEPTNDADRYDGGF